MNRNIAITNEDIEYASNKLLPKGASFNDERNERINFIKCLDTVDLKACPGSGKTTCLQAKLLIIDKYLPLSNGSGLLVLSHTNRAIDEIKIKLQPYCSRLFQNPNFIGTFQSFVDTFLSIPYFSQVKTKGTVRIDNDLYESKVVDFFTKEFPSNLQYGIRSRFKTESYNILNRIYLNENGELVKDINSVDFYYNKTTNTYKALFKMKLHLMDKGFLSYEDAYFLAFRYLKKYPTIKKLLQARFYYVFIDEMQDTDNHQLLLIEQIFRNSDTVIQRIGDPNQSIFNYVKEENVWDPPIEGINYMELTGSLRLSKPIAKTIKNIARYPQELSGNEQNGEIKPHIILFDDETKTNVIPTYGNLILEFDLCEKGNHTFKVVGWRKNVDDKTDEKLVLNDYWTGYEKEIQPKRSHFKCLKGYLKYIQAIVNSSNSMELTPFYHSIMNALVKVLWIVDKKTPEDIYFTISRLNKYLFENEKEFYYSLKQQIFDWSIKLSWSESINIIWAELNQYIQNELRVKFDFQITSELYDFLNNDIEENSKSTTQTIVTNTFSHIYSGEKPQYNGKEIEIHVSTIHGVKGETHAGTLYLETYYKNDSRKKDGSFISYESQRIMEQLKGIQFTGSGTHKIETLKMAYVGMSRPTHLLCVALHRDRVNCHEEGLRRNGWEIIEA